MEFTKTETVPFFDEVFEVKMTGLEAAILYALVAKSTTSTTADYIRSLDIEHPSELIHHVESKADPQLRMYRDLADFLRSNDMKEEVY